jgi:hypothetical protein
LIHIFTSISERLKGCINFDGLFRRYLELARYCQDLFQYLIVSGIEEIMSAFIDNLLGGYASGAFLPSLKVVPLDCGTPAVLVETEF